MPRPCWFPQRRLDILIKRATKGASGAPGSPSQITNTNYLIQFPFNVHEYPTTKYMTLGPTFYTKLVLSPKYYFCFVNPYFLAGSAAFYLYIHMLVSKQDLKHFSKSDLPGFTGGVFMDFCPRRVT